MEVIALSDDGTNFRMHEPNHSTLPRDMKACLQKYRHAATKYEIALAVHHAKVLHIAGPFKGGVHNLEMYQTGGLKDKLGKANSTNRGVRRVKLMLVDRGYISHKEGKGEFLRFQMGMTRKS
jgi:hypothetical protein